MMQVQQREKKEDHYFNFVNALKSNTTKKDYTKRLSYFMDFLGIKNYNELVENRDKKWIENNIKNFLVYLRNERKISYKSAAYYFEVVKKFYYVNTDFEFKWNLIKQYLGDDDDDVNYDSSSSSIEDRPYTKQEIQTMLKTATDIRVKIIILLISSTGMRMGAIHLLRLRNLSKIEKYNLYQINVYEKSKKSNYKTFCTPECASVIDSYLNYREHAGETLKPEAPLIREQFNPKDDFKVKNPKNISKGLVTYLVNEVLTKYSTLKKKIEYDYENKRKKIGKKNETMLTHALRKYFDTESRKAGVYPDIVELLMGHKLPGVKKHYFKLDIQTLLEGTTECKGYVAAIDALTINDENRLKKEKQELVKESEYKDYLIQQKLQQKDLEIEKMQQQIQTLTNITNKNNEEFTNIAKQIQDIEKRTKVDPETLKKIRNREIDSVELWLKDMKDKEKKKQKLLDQVKKYNNNSTIS